MYQISCHEQEEKAMHLYDDVRHWAEKFPEQIFLLWRGKALSYSEAYSRVCAIAASLSPWRGQVLGLRFSDPPSQVLYFLGAMMAGAVPVLLHEYLKEEDIAALLRERPIGGLLSDTCFEGLKMQPAGELWQLEGNETRACADFGVLTSGTSGLAKVLFRKEASWRDFFPVQNDIFHIDRHAVLYLSGSMAFTGNLNMLMAFLYAGGTIAGTEAVQPKTWMKDIGLTQATHVYMIPSKLFALCRSKGEAPSVTHILTGSQLMTKRLLDALTLHFPMSCTILYYGASELSYVSYIEGKDILIHPNAVGRPFPGISISIRDEEIYVDTPYAVEGTDHPLTCHDMGRIDEEGMLYFLGRREDQYHIKGNHVSRQKVLSHLLMLPGVEEAEVIGEKMANGDDRLIAFLSGDMPASEAALLRLLAEKLRPWEIPHRILRVSSIPKTSTGKTDRKRLLAMADASSLKSGK